VHFCVTPDLGVSSSCHQVVRILMVGLSHRTRRLNMRRLSLSGLYTFFLCIRPQGDDFGGRTTNLEPR
jgi:hypothetical protein